MGFPDVWNSLSEDEQRSHWDALDETGQQQLLSELQGGSAEPSPPPLPAYSPAPGDPTSLSKEDLDFQKKYPIADYPEGPGFLDIAGKNLKDAAYNTAKFGVEMGAGLIAPEILGPAKAIPYVGRALSTVAANLGFHGAREGIETALEGQSPEQAGKDLYQEMVPGFDKETALNYGVSLAAQGVKAVGGMVKKGGEMLTGAVDRDQALYNAAGGTKADRVLHNTEGEIPVKNDLDTLSAAGVDLRDPIITTAKHPAEVARQTIVPVLEKTAETLSKIGQASKSADAKEVIDEVRQNIVPNLGGEQARLADRMLAWDEAHLVAKDPITLVDESGNLIRPSRVKFSDVLTERVGQDQKARWDDVPGPVAMKADVARALRQGYANVLTKLVPENLQAEYLRANATYSASKNIWDDMERGALESVGGRGAGQKAEQAAGFVTPGRTLVRGIITNTLGPPSTDMNLRRSGGTAFHQRVGDTMESAGDALQSLIPDAERVAVGVDSMRPDHMPPNITGAILPSPKQEDGTYLSREVSNQSVDNVVQAVASRTQDPLALRQAQIGAMRAFASRDQRKIGVFLTQLHKLYPDLPFERGPITGRDSEWMIDGKHFLLDPADAFWWKSQIDASNLPSTEKAFRVSALNRDQMVVPMDTPAVSVPQGFNNPTQAEEASVSRVFENSPKAPRIRNSFGSRKIETEGY